MLRIFHSVNFRKRHIECSFDFRWRTRLACTERCTWLNLCWCSLSLSLCNIMHASIRCDETHACPSSCTTLLMLCFYSMAWIYIARMSDSLQRLNYSISGLVGTAHASHVNSKAKHNLTRSCLAKFNKHCTG